MSFLSRQVFNFDSFRIGSEKEICNLLLLNISIKKEKEIKNIIVANLGSSGISSFQIGCVFVENDLLNTTTLIQNCIYMNFRIKEFATTSNI